MSALSVIPWGETPFIVWDDENVEHVAKHGVEPWEVEEMIYEGEMVGIRHPKWRKGAKYARRFMLSGATLGGRRLLVIVDRIGARRLRPVTAWSEK